ncbi:MAG: hypothetical protein IJT94_01295 [Oscillibacter sp.]|nr:hypothetical protein [Oscillibacter sp.]
MFGIHWNWKKAAVFAGGALFGSAGVKLLTSRDAKTAYTHMTAAALRCRDSVLCTVDRARECAGDILADAKEINEKRGAAQTEQDAEEENA